MIKKIKSLISLKLKFDSSIAGVLDAGFSSLATFISSIIAAHFFNPTDLGSYSILFSLIILSSLIPEQLIFVPSERYSIKFLENERTINLNINLMRGVLVSSLFSSIFISIPFFISILKWEKNSILLALSGWLCALIWPLQDHIRRLLHFAAFHYVASCLSFINFIGVIITCIIGWLIDVPMILIPFLSLFVGNCASLFIGAAFCYRKNKILPNKNILSLKVLFSSGKWLLLSFIIPSFSAFLTEAIISALGGITVLGYATAARIVASPVIVLARGISFSIGPKLMKFGKEHDQKSAKKIINNYNKIVYLCTIAYLIIVGCNWNGNPMTYLVPNAFAIKGIVLFSIISNLFVAAIFPYRLELIGCHMEKSLFFVEIFSNIGRIASATSVFFVYSFALPLSYISISICQFYGYRTCLSKYYNK